MKGFLFKEQNLIVSAQVCFLCLILVPFIFFSAELEAWLEQLVDGERNFEIAAAAITLLSLDVLLPVPSSFVNMATTLYLGPILGFCIVFTGLTVSCLIGYWFGYYFRKALFDRFYQDPAFRKLTFDITRYGFVTLVTARGMLVIAELSVMVAGYHQYPLRNFLFAIVLSNALLALIYAVFVSLSTNVHSPVFLLFTLVAVPCSAIVIRFCWNTWQHRENPEREVGEVKS